MGDTYVSMEQEDAIAQLEQDTKRTDEELARLQQVMDECESEMKELKVALYAKFGSNISRSVALIQIWNASKVWIAQIEKLSRLRKDHFDRNAACLVHTGN